MNRHLPLYILTAATLLLSACTPLRPRASTKSHAIGWPQFTANESAISLPALPSKSDAPSADQSLLEKPLTLDALKQYALEKNPSIAAAKAHVRAAQSHAAQIGMRPNTRIGFSAQQIGSSADIEQIGIAVEQEILRGNKRQLDQEISEHDVNRFRQVLQSQQQRVQTDVAIGYFNVLCTQKRVELLTNITHINEKATAAVEALFESKEVSKRDLLQARIESNTSKSLLQLTQSEHAAAWQVLAAVVGSTEIIDQPLVGDLDNAADQIVWESSLEHLLASSPEIAARQASVRQAKAAVRRAQAESVPNINIQAIVQHDNSIGAANGNLMVSIPVPMKNKTRARVREAEHKWIAAQQVVASLRLQLQQRLAPVFQAYTSSQQQITTYRESILVDAQESLDLTKLGYEGGEFSYLELLTAQRTYSQANLDYLAALLKLSVARAKINGLLLTDSLQVQLEEGN